MKPEFVKRLLAVCLFFCSLAASGQMPTSPCGPSGGKRADVIGMEVKYSSPGSSTPAFTIPAGAKSISVYISSETGITSGGNDFAQGDEDFITVNAIIDIASGTSSGYVNYAKSTFTDGSGTNVYGWRNVPLGAFIPVASKVGDAVPDLNNVSFTISGSTLIIAQTETGMHSSFYVQYLSPYSNSLNLLVPQVKALLHGTAPANTDLVMPIPAGADIIFISGKGTNSSDGDLSTADGTEEGYANFRFTIDLAKGWTDGFATVANGGSANRRSTYVVSKMSTTNQNKLTESGAASGDVSGKSRNTGSVALYDPQIYISGGNLVIKRDASYARDFDDAYVVEFYERTGQGMSAEFVNSDIQFISKGLSSLAGVSRTFTIPPGTNAIYFNETGNAVNVSRESNENSLEAYAYIDLATETASGYFYQQVGLSLTQRRDDNYAFKGVPLNNSSTRSHANTVGFKGPYEYDISFSLSADKRQLTVTNKTGLANPDYQILLSADYYGSKPDIAFNVSAVSFEKIAGTKTVRAKVAVCNPGAGNSNGGMPVSFYHGDPTVDPAAKLLYTGTFSEGMQAGECKDFYFDIDLKDFTDLNIHLTIVINDNGSFVSGGVGNTVGTPFTLTSLAGQQSTYQECFYGNNLITKKISVNNSPVVTPDPDNSSGATGAYNYLNYFTAGTTAGAKIADTDLQIVDPDASNLSSATITLTNAPDAGDEGLYLEGTLPPGISISGDGTHTITLAGAAPQADYVAALKMIVYRNSKGSPNTTDRIIKASVNDGTETGPASTTTIVIQTEPLIGVKGKNNLIEDNSTEASVSDGTDFGLVMGITTHTFSIHNLGTGIIELTATPAVSSTGDAGFTISAQPAGKLISAGGNTDFTISFDPAGKGAGTYTAVVSIKNDDPEASRSDYTFEVSATINNLPVVKDHSVSGDEDNTVDFNATDFVDLYTDADHTALNKIKITSLPLNGAFNLDNSPIAIGQEILSSDLGNIKFVPTANWNGSTGFDWRASDGISYSATTALTTINIAAVNDGPGITLPAGMPVTEDVDAALKDIVFSDIDAGTSSVTATFATTEGKWSAVSGNGVTISEAPSSIILDGTIDDINAFLADKKLTYSTVQNPSPSLEVTIVISDKGNTGKGGVLQDNKKLVLEVTAVNDAPTGTGDQRTTEEDNPVNGAVTGKDVEGDELAYTKADEPLHGTVVVKSEDGTYTYTPKANYNGTDHFKITISDGKGGTVTVPVDITVTPVNDIPVGTGDARTTKENTPVSGAVSATDGDGDELIFTKADDPDHGDVVVTSKGAYTYTPNTDYTGPDKFTIDINDGNGGSTTVTVNITVTPVNIPPVNTPPTGTDDTKSTEANTPVNGKVTGSDGDGDVLVYTKATEPAHGSASVNPDGTYTYKPNTDYTGPDKFTIDINDGNGGSTTVTVNITVTSVNIPPVNTPPTGTDDAKSTEANTPVNGRVMGADADGDALVYSKATEPAHGTASVNPDGTYTYKPNTDYTGPDQFTIDIKDGNGGSTTVTVTITVTPVSIPPVNTPPTGTDDAKSTEANTLVNGSVTGADADGDALVYSKATEPAHGTASVNPDGTYTYKPNTDYTGTDKFTIDINDGNGGSTTVTVTITVTPVNVPPVNTPPTGKGDTKSTEANTPVNGEVIGADADGDALTYAKATDPTHGTASVNPDGTYTYKPNTDYNGPDKFTIDIKDGNGGSTTVTVTITVTPVNIPPVNTPPTGKGDTRSTEANKQVSSRVTGADADGDALVYTKATDPAHGIASVNPDGTYIYKPNTNYSGTDRFTIDINDGNGGHTTVTVYITVTAVNIPPVNKPPTGEGDTKSTNENTPVSGVVTGSDADGDALTFTKAANPAHGTASVNINGAYTYTPAAGYSGPDKFTVNITDGKGGATTVTVNITVIPLPVNPGISIVKTGVLSTDNLSILYSFTVTNTGNVTLYNITVTDPMLRLNKIIAGDLRPGASTGLTAAYMLTQADREKGSVHNTATAKGQTVKQVTVTDISGTTVDNDNPTKTQLPRPPQAVDDEAGTKGNTPVIVPLLKNDDPAQSAFNARGITIIRQPAHGTVIINAEGTVTYMPVFGFSGDDSFTYQVRNTGGYMTNVATVVLHVAQQEDLKIPTLFTPNNDGKNDVFEIRGLHLYAENELVVINRWGNEVYRQKNYQNNWKGDGLNEGTYYYLLRVRKADGSAWEVLKGYTTLIRKFKQ